MTGNHTQASSARDRVVHASSGALTTPVAVSEQARSHVHALTDRFAEHMHEIVREHASTVKRWRDGEMVLRWAAAGMECPRAQFRRVKGYRQLPRLAAALEAATAEEPGLLNLRVSA